MHYRHYISKNPEALKSGSDVFFSHCYCSARLRSTKMSVSRNILIIVSALLAMSSASSLKRSHRDEIADLSWLFSLEDLDIDNNEEINKAKIKKPKICETTECHQIAEEFLKAMNKSADPCQDFYEFSCGQWAKKPPPKYTPNWSRNEVFEAAVRHRIRKVLEIEPMKTDILPVRQAKKWYRSCMDKKSRESRGLKPIESILMQIGGWPLTIDIAEWDENDYMWQKVDEHFVRVTGDATLFGIEILPSLDGDGHLGKINIVEPKIPFSDQLPLKYRNYTGDDHVAYTVLIQGIARLFINHNSANVSDAQLEKDIEDMINFEKSIYEMSKNQTSTNSILESLDEYPNLGDFIDFFDKNVTQSTSDSRAKIYWQRIFLQIFDMINIEVDDSTPIYFQNSEYLIKLPKLLESTSKRTIINYIHWKFVSEYMRYTIDEAAEMFFELEKDEYGVQERLPRWQDCVVQMKMSDAAAYVFVNEYYPKEKDDLVQKVLQAVKDSIKSQIENSSWMNTWAKKAAIKKLDNMRSFIGFPDWYRNETAVIQNYKGLTIGSEYLDNVLSFVRYKRKSELKAFEGHFIGNDQQDYWWMNAITINAVYFNNTITVPAANFQSPLFDEKVPDYVNYGTAGSTIGHEMGHGFDDSGIRDGLDIGGEMLSRRMLRMYYQQAKCFSTQYNEYFGSQTAPPQSYGMTFENEKWTLGLKTRGENIADSTGLQAVFDAYKKMMKIDHPNGELRLSGFEEFNDDQMFFISYAQSWCETSTPEHIAKSIKIDVHSPARLRVIGPVSNMKDFAKVFNCPLGSPMNPENKCNIWMESGAQTMLNHEWYKWNHAGSWRNNWK